MAEVPQDASKESIKKPNGNEPRCTKSLPWRERCRRACRLAFTGFAALLGLSVIPVAILTSTVPDRKEIKETGYATKTTRLYDAHDQLIFSVEKEERTPVQLASISPDIQHAVLAVEDERFYRHIGIDGVRIAGALAADIKHRRFAEGASTITQQLARQMFLNDRKTLWRKLQEIVVAFRIERQFDKDKIFELYLNEVYFGHGYYGIEAASRGYFGKSASAVTLPEAAMLAGLIKAPSTYSPRTHLDRARERRAIVLKRMVEADYIDKARASAEASAPVVLAKTIPEPPFARYFKSYVVQDLVQRLGEEAVYEGGLNVYTTLDPDIQKAAETALNEGLLKIEAQPRYRHPKRGTAWHARTGDAATPYLQGAILAMTPNGHIAALVGGRDYNDSAFDRATQAKRQPGSAFKPFIYAAALESGLTPSTVISGLAPMIDDTGMATKPAAWWPNEAHASTTDQMTMRTALRTSSNRAAAMVLTEVGLARTLSFVRQFGFNAPPVPSMALGTGEVTVLDLTAAYAAFANHGRVPKPVAIRRVENRSGQVVLEDVPSESQAVGAVTAFQTAEMLADVINSGSGYAVRRAGFARPAGGKTGTTDDFKDAWFAGFTPELVATVWLGFDDPKTIVREQFGGDLAAPIWGRLMKMTESSRGSAWISPPPGLMSAKICKLSGLLANPECAAATAVDRKGQVSTRNYVGTEHFRAGTAPAMFCNIHGVEEPLLPTPDGAIAPLDLAKPEALPPSLPPQPAAVPAPAGRISQPPPAPMGSKPTDINETLKTLPKP
jgi:1A family penicillin-binding protein